MCKELHFPSREFCYKNHIIRREVKIPSSFDNILSYRSVLSSAIRGMSYFDNNCQFYISSLQYAVTIPLTIC